MLVQKSGKNLSKLTKAQMVDEKFSEENLCSTNLFTKVNCKNIKIRCILQTNVVSFNEFKETDAIADMKLRSIFRIFDIFRKFHII